MRLLRLSGLSAALFLVLAMLPMSASATNGRPADPVQAGSTPAAARALAAVQAAFAPGGQVPGRRTKATGGRTDATMLLLDLHRHLRGLSPEDRRTAGRYFARPTDGNDPFVNYSRRARATSDCQVQPRKSPKFCVHWARRTSDAPSTADSDRDGIPNQVELTRRVVGNVWHREVTRGGYRAPLADGTRGGNGKLDVYIANIGNEGVYGYCVNERRVTGRAFYGYCVLDDDYSHREFPSNTPKQNLKVTAAHEFFHAVQFAYDAYDDPWFMESTATWIEDEVYDGINDNRFYLSDSPLRSPFRPLDYDQGSLHVYGDWIFWRYLTERFPGTGGSGLPILVRRTWENADASHPPPDHYSLKALDMVLKARGADLGQLYGDFSTANRRPADFYEEGNAYRAAPLVPRQPFVLTSSQPEVTRAPVLDHLSSNTVAFQPGTGSKRLDITINGPSSGHKPVVQAVVVHDDGTADAPVQVSLTSTGNGTVILPFAKSGDPSTSIKQVELTLTNGGHAFTCWQGQDWSCSGRPKDDNQTFQYTATRLTS